MHALAKYLDHYAVHGYILYECGQIACQVKLLVLLKKIAAVALLLMSGSVIFNHGLQNYIIKNKKILPHKLLIKIF